MNVYTYCDATKMKLDGSYPVLIVVRNNRGRFFVNTKLYTFNKFIGREFPKTEPNARSKSNALNKYLLEIEEL